MHKPVAHHPPKNENSVVWRLMEAWQKQNHVLRVKWTANKIMRSLKPHCRGRAVSPSTAPPWPKKAPALDTAPPWLRNVETGMCHLLQPPSKAVWENGSTPPQTCRVSGIPVQSCPASKGPTVCGSGMALRLGCIEFNFRTYKTI